MSISSLFHTFLYEPLFNALILIYNFLPGHDLGIAVIILTLVIKILTFPLNQRALKYQKIMSKIQPQLKEIQKKYKDDPQEQARQTKELFQREKVNPFSSILPILIQLPVLIALYQVFWKGLWDINSHFYSFVVRPESLSPIFLGLVDLSKPNSLMAILAALAQFIQSLTMPSQKPSSANQDSQEKMMLMMQKQMNFIFPAMTFFILVKLPSVLALYWLATSVFAIIQQIILNKNYVSSRAVNNN